MANLDWSQFPAVESIPGKVSGAWVFKDTRLPVSTVFENFESGATIDDILEWFDVTREQVVAVLEFAARSQGANDLAVIRSRLAEWEINLGIAAGRRGIHGRGYLTDMTWKPAFSAAVSNSPFAGLSQPTSFALVTVTATSRTDEKVPSQKPRLILSCFLPRTVTGKLTLPELQPGGIDTFLNA